MDFKLFMSIVLSLFIEICSQEDFYFIKTLDGAIFQTNLNPSLVQNVSYIQAIDLNNRQVSYYINNLNDFIVDKTSGRVYLISKLTPNFRQISTDITIEIKASNGFKNITLLNKVKIFNSNDRPPEFVDSINFIEIEEDNDFPNNLKFLNGSSYELYIRNPYPITNKVSVLCENLPTHPEACETFNIVENVQKTTINEWFGRIIVTKNLDYTKKSIFMFLLVASNSPINIKKLSFQIKVLPSVKKAAQLSSSSYFFSIPENQPPYTLIGQLKLNEGYDKDIQSFNQISLVYSPDELNDNINDDVQFELVKKYLTIDLDNKLLTLSIMDRDSLEFQNINAVLKAWIKITNKLRADVVNFFKISILIIDLNDNQPKFNRMTSTNFGINQFSNFDNQTILYSTIKENELGPVIFNEFSTSSLVNNSFYFHDLDYGDNSKFELKINDYKPNNSLTSCYPNELDLYFKMNNLIESASSLNLINTIPFDFDSLNIFPIFDNNGVAYKNFNLTLIAQETDSREKYQSKLLSILLRIQDINDNRPIFNQDSYYVFIKNFSYNNLPQSIIKFDISDRDIGIYGIEGLNCFLLGHGSEKFIVDTIHKQVLIKPCNRLCTIDNFNEIYHLTLMCKDNLGKGHVAFSNLIISFKDIVRPGFKVPAYTYYLLASGPTGTEIPELIIKPVALDTLNKVTFKIQNNEMKNLFEVDENGTFKIIANRLDMSQTQNGAFHVVIIITDKFYNINMVTVIVHLSNLLSKNQCPKISESAMCKFSIDRETFDSNRIRFCFYGASPISYNLNFNSVSFYNKIYYSLTPDSPEFLYINPQDGCVKILPSLDFDNLENNYIEYSVGVFNPLYPDCVNINKRNCLITVESLKDKQIKCYNKYQLVDNSTSFKLNAYSPNPNSILHFSIIREERTTFDGTYENITDDMSKFYKIRSNDGFIELNRIDKLIDYQSILLFIRIRDLTLYSYSTECLVDFKFCNLNSKSPKFIGFGLRYENICEDLPVNSLLMSLKAFDPNRSNKPLCYSLANNAYFSLISSGQNENGDIYLKQKINLKQIKYENGNSYLNFTAYLSYCQTTDILNKQMINVNIMNVNKYPPKLALKSSIVQISYLNNGNNSITSFDVTDEDISPYDYFQCTVINNDNFALVNNNDLRKVYLTPKSLFFETYQTYFDLTIKCCDDSKYWTENNCHSVPKCSLSLLRVEFTDFIEPIFCLNNKQVFYVDENSKIKSEIASVKCINNMNDLKIGYTLITQTNLVTINPTNGSIILNSRNNKDLENIKVSCSNGKSTSICEINLAFIFQNDYRPIWIYPNPQESHFCVNINEDAKIGSLVARVNAVILNTNIPITYYFVIDGLIFDSVYEFKFENQRSGDIYLKKKLNRLESIQRELTLAAAIVRPNDLQPIIVYQYFCINILPAVTYQPCFRTLPNYEKWPFEINILESKKDCYYDQIASIYNKDALTPQVYYYLIQSDILVYNIFDLNAATGLLCKNKIYQSQNITDFILKSSQKYIDEFDNLSYNLYIYASKRKLTFDEVKSIKYDNTNCSFSYFKLIAGKNQVQNNTNIKLKPIRCESVISLDKISLMDRQCLFKFEFENTKSENDLYTYEIKSLTNPFDSSIFNVNSNTDCLTLKFEYGINKFSYLNKHEFLVSIKNKCGICDSTVCRIYATQGCWQRSFLLIMDDRATVERNINKYLMFINETLFNSVQIKFQVLFNQLIDLSNLKDRYQETKFNGAKTLLEFSVFDASNDIFMANIGFISVINKNVKNTNDLAIQESISSCPTIIQETNVDRSIAISLVSFFFGLLFFIAPLILCCYLCPAFKRLKYKDNRVILKDKVIPIVGDCQSPACPSFIASNSYINTGEFPFSNKCDKIFEEPTEKMCTLRKDHSGQILRPRFETKSFKPNSFQPQEMSIRVRENIRPVREEIIKMGDMARINENKENYLDEIREVGTVSLNQNNYDYYEQNDTIVAASNENLI